ncbi:hypothetical protein D3C72_1497500 [compost metagenome]
MLSWKTGTSAFGYRCFSTVQVPWSSPHCSVAITGACLTAPIASRASAGWPGAGYSMSNSACGKPPKSWIVLGRVCTVTPVAPWLSQCADTLRIAVGRGSSRPQAARRRVKALSASAFIGEPWPMKMTGMRRAGAAPAACAISVIDASAAVAPSAEPMRKPRRPSRRVIGVEVIVSGGVDSGPTRDCATE